jgi:putative endonuclease
VNKRYWVYMLASQHNGTLYIGASSDLITRVWQHKNKVIEGFTEQYDVDRLVWFEEQLDAHSMVTRERQLKKWNREWKVRLIEKRNPEWNDLYTSIL